MHDNAWVDGRVRILTRKNSKVWYGAGRGGGVLSHERAAQRQQQQKQQHQASLLVRHDWSMNRAAPSTLLSFEVVGNAHGTNWARWALAAPVGGARGVVNIHACKDV